MYRRCIFCSADLGSNDSIEPFPVGRSLAFDAGRGRLWAVCTSCARWNLAPVEERWEAIEQAERLFRDTRQRVQSENIGLARLRDGTRLVRVGEAVPGELAAWRYGEQLVVRQRRAARYGAAATAVGVGIVVAGLAATSIGLGGSLALYHAYDLLGRRARGKRTVGWVDTTGPSGAPQRVRVRHEHAVRAWVTAPEDEQGIALNLPHYISVPDPDRPGHTCKQPLVLRGWQAQALMARAMVHVNTEGAAHLQVRNALEMIRLAGSPEAYVHQVARRRLLLTGADPRRIPRPDRSWDTLFLPREGPSPNHVISLALEMAVHEETERRAMEGELSMLEAMWRDAEQIAAIADRLPDDLPPSDSPRI